MLMSFLLCCSLGSYCRHTLRDDRVVIMEQKLGANMAATDVVGMVEAADWSVDQFGGGVSPSRVSEIIRQS